MNIILVTLVTTTDKNTNSKSNTCNSSQHSSSRNTTQSTNCNKSSTSGSTNQNHSKISNNILLTVIRVIEAVIIKGIDNSV